MSALQKPTPIKYCAYCGQKLERVRYPSKLEDLGAFKRRKYCSRECMKRAFVETDGTNQRNNDAHASARKIAYLIEEREKVCSICGSTRNVDIHHKDGNYHNNSSDNLIALCRSCHNKEHHKKGVCKLCGKPMKGYGYCNMHYIRWKKYGDPLVCRRRIVSPTFTDRWS